MTFLTDHSGRVFTTKKCSLKDVVANADATLTAVTISMYL